MSGQMTPLRVEFETRLWELQQLFSTCTLVAEPEVCNVLIEGANVLHQLVLGEGDIRNPIPAVTQVLRSLGSTIEARSFDSKSWTFTFEGNKVPERGDPLSLVLRITTSLQS